MPSGKKIKLVIFELLELAAFSIPTLVVMEQFAKTYHNIMNNSEKTHYWLIVSCSIAYVASASLLIWVPVKVLFFKKRHLYQKIKGWRPVMMMYVVLTTLPSFSFSIAMTEVQKSTNDTISAAIPDTLPDLPVSLVLTSLIVVDIIEKLRIYPLRGELKSKETTEIHSSTLQNIKTVTEQVHRNEENSVPPQPARRTQIPQPRRTNTESPTLNVEGPQEPCFDSGVLRAASSSDPRSEIFLGSFLLWSDTIEMVRVTGHPAVYKSGWVYPVYIFSFISLLRIILTPQNPLSNCVGVLLQDIPFIFVRLSLIIVLGTITPVLGLCKNILVTLSYVYFNHLTKFRVFSTFEVS
ncbi:PREDICTED: transmembrane protein 236 [Condylura cristata]|uniref:transmembrane protein 236 n=1 Tax=Condylura cristata TaxID=143302 RepID=UPI0003343AF8|nr:PREDICTED: transmembrane protein 236 [Condylura cristata]